VTTVSPVAEQDGVREDATVRSTPARALAASTPRPVPQRVPELAHMNLKRLRTYRQTLLNEELRTSYWRRLLQARRDLLRADAGPGDRAALAEALTEQRVQNGRTAILMLHPDGGMPILPHLPDLWASGADESDEVERAELFARLASAESVLSSYREALHRRLDRATSELVARYHEDPRQCLDALPLER
jgi:hypothetical protein